MAERSNAHDSKSCYAGMYTRVQIPFSAPTKKDEFLLIFFCLCYEFRKGFEGGSRFAGAKRFANAKNFFISFDGKGDN